MLLLIDNYDSFVYNLYQALGAITPDIRVLRNDQLSIGEIAALCPQAIILSPGPGKPADAGICETAARELGKTLPVLGVCLGHQAICEAFGGVVSYAKALMHGKQSTATLAPDSKLFRGLPAAIKVARYHSLAAREETLPPELRVTARTADNEVMAVEHRDYPIYGVQFHPESILTPDGAAIIKNFLQIGGAVAS